MAVHPRVRGEHTLSGFPLRRDGGSSPRSRGTFRTMFRRPSVRRFIPAFAGNIMPGPGPGFRLAVHPRVRGEHDSFRCLECQLLGSSPRSRGTLIARRGSYTKARFIPAFAGNIGIPVTTARMRSVHPRVRGEHRSPADTHTERAGSSPRSRGTCLLIHRLNYTFRFIPAFAGNMIHATS